ncbi:hypothetical protein [Arcobacter sp. LA11]|uniref:hypothetical protein n=1 Tax=Arcobacter sp. LA11 TaxID=1898176 RepID=UPI000934CA68|nr:hypothetical protein [Arcobacter sp. LA11]
MQIMVFALVLIALAAFIIYKVNNKFETKEIVILLSVVIITIITVVFLSNKQEEIVPKIFKEKYEKEKNVNILKLSFERLNNKNVSSKVNFLYTFDYIIKKDGKELFCTAKEVRVKKIEDEYIFENLNTLKEDCNTKQ